MTVLTHLATNNRRSVGADQFEDHADHHFALAVHGRQPPANLAADNNLGNLIQIDRSPILDLEDYPLQIADFFGKADRTNNVLLSVFNQELCARITVVGFNLFLDLIDGQIVA